MKAPLITIALLFATASIAQQSTVDQVLQQVLANNKRVSAHAAEVEALRLQERTGLSLPDPSVDFDYMNGSPATAGQQTDLTVTQPFDFPTAYGARRKVAELRTTQHEQEAIATRREVLLDAQRTCVALVHANKRAQLLAERHAAAVRYRDGMRQRFDREAATILDRNKAELLEAGIAADVQAAEMERLALLQHLAELNGGTVIVFTDTVYPAQPEMPAFETYEAAMEAADPTLRVLETEVEVSEEQTRAFRATGLPGFEIGYRYQGILGADYQGVHAGMNIPLWSNRNKVKQQQQWTAAHALRTAEHRVEHFYEARHLYDRAIALRAAAEEFEQRLAGANSSTLLEKAFNAGQITTLEYQMELLLLRESMDRWLRLEMEYQDALAELFKYRL
jgi:outer membrane protein, heavy metal efflux system